MSKTPKIKRSQFLAGAVAEGPIENPSDLAPALARAMAVVKKGEPALIDVVSQPR